MRVIVVGAGLAGLTCARTLAQHGHEVLVLEATAGVGGRVRSDYADGYTLDRGFQVLFDAYPAVRRHLDLTALDLRAFDPGAIICCNGRRATLTDPLRDHDVGSVVDAGITPAVTLRDKLLVLKLAIHLRSQSIAQVLDGPDTMTVTYLRALGFSIEIINRFFRPFFGGIFLDRSLETSAKCFKYDFKMLSEGQTALPAGGMGEISRQLAAPLLEQGRVQFHQHVLELLTDDGQVRGVQLEGGQRHSADALVVATPASEAARLTELPLPTAARATVTLYFTGDEPIYRSKKIVLNAAPDAFVNNAQLLTNVAPSYAPIGKHLLSVTVLGNPDISTELLYKNALRDLHQMFRGDLAAQAALAQYQPLRAYRIPFAQFAQPPAIHPTLPANRTERAGLYLAGEYTEASSLNAAMISGEKCAANILNDLHA